MKKYIKYIAELLKKFLKISLFMTGMKIIVTVLEITAPVLLQKIVDEGIVKKDKDSLLFFSIITIGCIVTLNILNFFFNKLAVIMKSKQSFDLKSTILDKLAGTNLNFYKQNSSGDILKTVESDISTLETISLDWVISTAIEFIGGIFVVGIIFNINRWLLLTLIVSELLIIVFQKKFVSVLSRNAVELRELGGRSMSYVEEFVSNIICAVYGKTTEYMKKRFVDNERTFIKKLNRQYNIAEANQLISNSIDRVLRVLIYLIGGIFVINDKMSYGELIAFSQYIALIIAPVFTVIRSFSKIQLAIVSLNKVEHLLEIPPVECGTAKIETDAIADISFNNVSLGYDDEMILRDLNIDLKYGNTYAFIGENGSGKSTIIKALYRMIDSAKGEIKVFNQNINYWDIDELRKQIGLVSQEVFIINDTVRNNITLGRNVDETEFNKVINIVGLSELIYESENNTTGENGVGLSGGQRQKIAIARMLLSGAKILIFDEATSAIDNYAQDKILKAINDNYSDRLVIIIGHRLDAIKFADYLYYIGDNSILEQGTLSELKNTASKAGALIFDTVA